MKLAHTMIRVRDLDESLAFYVDFLELKEVRRKPIGDEATLVFLADAAESYFIELTVNHDGRDYVLGDQFGHLAFYVDDLEPFVAKVEARGLDFRRSKLTSGSKYIFIKDPDGYDIEVLEEKTAPV